MYALITRDQLWVNTGPYILPLTMVKDTEYWPLQTQVSTNHGAHQYTGSNIIVTVYSRSLLQQGRIVSISPAARWFLMTSKNRNKLYNIWVSCYSYSVNKQPNLFSKDAVFRNIWNGQSWGARGFLLTADGEDDGNS